MQLDLLNQTYQSRALDENQSQLINMYLEADASKGKYKVIALPTAGLTLFTDTLGSQVRGLFNQKEILYAVVDNGFYSIDSLGNKTLLGTLNTSTGRVKIKSITGGSNTNNQIFIKDGTNCYTYNIGTSTATFPVADVNCPQNCDDIEAQDNYILALNHNSTVFNICNTADTTTWNALGFASKEGQADLCKALLSHEGKIWLLGNKTSEIWYDAGTAGNMPFAKDTTTFLEYGIGAKDSIVGNENYWIMLGKNQSGGYSFYQTLPRIYYYNPMPISTQPIDYLLNTFSTVDDAFAYIYEIAGHCFYECTFPTAGYTFTYDIPRSNQSDTNKGTWSFRQSYNGSAYTNFLGNCAAFCYNKRLIGDANSGKIYYQNTEAYTENGISIIRQFVSPTVYQGGKRMIVDRLQIDVETGIGNNNTFTLEKSLDNGNSWTTVNTYTVPSRGGRIYETRLGSSRVGILFRITTTMNAKFILLGFQVEMSLGHS